MFPVYLYSVFDRRAIHVFPTVILLLILSWNNIYTGIKFMNSTNALMIDTTQTRELIELKRFLGTPMGNPINAKSVNGKDIVYTEQKMDCHRIPLGSSGDRKTILMKRCPLLRDEQFNLHAGRVAQILSNKQSKLSFQQQKDEFMKEVFGMAKTAGELPTLQFG